MAMRIFYYFQDLETNMYNWQRFHFIDELKHYGIEFYIFNPLYYENVGEANESALKIIREKGFDLFLSNVCYHKMLFPSTLMEIKSIGIPSVSIRCDNLTIPFYDKILAPYFDLVWLTSIETKYLYDKWGVNSFFAPYAANPFTFNYKASLINRNVCFIGTPYGSRSIMINTLTEADVNVDLYYGGKNRNNIQKKNNLRSGIITPSRLETVFNRIRFLEGRRLLEGYFMNFIKGQHTINRNEHLSNYDSLNIEEMIKSYSSYSLSLSSTSTCDTDVLKNPLKIINLRNFEIPMCGGIELCRYNKELANYFEDGKEIIFYQTNEELVDKAKYYTQQATDNEIIKIKNSARKRAESDHSWKCRFREVFNQIGINSIL